MPTPLEIAEKEAKEARDALAKAAMRVQALHGDSLPPPTTLPPPATFSGAADGKLDPSQPDTVVGPLALAPELGPSKMQEKDLDPASLRTRMWGSKREPNAAAIFRRYGGKAKLEELPDNSA